MTWSCCRAELGMDEVGEPQPCLGCERSDIAALSQPCHSQATALPQPCQSSATATCLSPLCRCPMVTAMVRWLWALCSYHCAPFGVGSPPFPLCPQMSPLALP